MPPPVPSAFRPGKTLGDLGGEIPACFNQLNGGNGLCHCQHVELLLERVKAIEEDNKGRDPSKVLTRGKKQDVALMPKSVVLQKMTTTTRSTST